ncbi:MAG: hypothetical protein U0470_06090 [Anaerolineae bacterium]
MKIDHRHIGGRCVRRSAKPAKRGEQRGLLGLLGTRDLDDGVDVVAYIAARRPNVTACAGGARGGRAALESGDAVGRPEAVQVGVDVAHAARQGGSVADEGDEAAARRRPAFGQGG